ncbi:MAG: hypothetical protein ACLFPS_07905 [Clostridia bacterium]
MLINKIKEETKLAQYLEYGETFVWQGRQYVYTEANWLVEEGFKNSVLAFNLRDSCIEEIPKEEMVQIKHFTISEVND